MTIPESHKKYDPNINYIGPMNWPKWALALINDVTLGEFNYAAYMHDIGAMAHTELLREENDKAFYRRLDEIVEKEQNFFKRQYLRFFKHFFYKAVLANPGHYSGDEFKIKFKRNIKDLFQRQAIEKQNMLEKFSEERNKIYEQLQEVSEDRSTIYKELVELRSMIDKLSKPVDGPDSALKSIKQKRLKG